MDENYKLRITKIMLLGKWNKMNAKFFRLFSLLFFPFFSFNFHNLVHHDHEQFSLKFQNDNFCNFRTRNRPGGTKLLHELRVECK